jgi:hypothetical protein
LASKPPRSWTGVGSQVSICTRCVHVRKMAHANMVKVRAKFGMHVWA